MKKIRKFFLLFFLTFTCDRNIPDIIIENVDGGFVNLALNISEIKIDSNGRILVTAESLYQQEKIGFQIEILNDPNILQPIWGKGYFINTGKNTERFINLLANLYSVNQKQAKQKKIPISLTYLSGEPRLINSEPIHTKFFFNSETGEEEYYAEVFINIDANKKILEFHEKDDEYRKSLINSLYGK